MELLISWLMFGVIILAWFIYSRSNAPAKKGHRPRKPRQPRGTPPSGGSSGVKPD